MPRLNDLFQITQTAFTIVSDVMRASAIIQSPNVTPQQRAEASSYIAKVGANLGQLGKDAVQIAEHWDDPWMKQKEREQVQLPAVSPHQLPPNRPLAQPPTLPRQTNLNAVWKTEQNDIFALVHNVTTRGIIYTIQRMSNGRLIPNAFNRYKGVANPTQQGSFIFLVSGYNSAGQLLLLSGQSDPSNTIIDLRAIAIDKSVITEASQEKVYRAMNL